MNTRGLSHSQEEAKICLKVIKKVTPLFINILVLTLEISILNSLYIAHFLFQKYSSTLFNLWTIQPPQIRREPNLRIAVRGVFVFPFLKII